MSDQLTGRLEVQLFARTLPKISDVCDSKISIVFSQHLLGLSLIFPPLLMVGSYPKPAGTQHQR